MFDEDYKEIPITAIVTGLAEIDPDTKIGRKFRNEYNYFEFRSRVEDKTTLFALPESIFCEGQTDKQPIPKIPYQFSFTEEVVVNGERSAKTTKVIIIKKDFNFKNLLILT